MLKIKSAARTAASRYFGSSKTREANAKPPIMSSNTTPLIRASVEAETEDRLNELMSMVEAEFESAMEAAK